MQSEKKQHVWTYSTQFVCIWQRSCRRSSSAPAGHLPPGGRYFRKPLDFQTPICQFAGERRQPEYPFALCARMPDHWNPPETVVPERQRRKGIGLYEQKTDFRHCRRGGRAGYRNAPARYGRADPAGHPHIGYAGSVSDFARDGGAAGTGDLPGQLRADAGSGHHPQLWQGSHRLQPAHCFLHPRLLWHRRRPDLHPPEPEAAAAAAALLESPM